MTPEEIEERILDLTSEWHAGPNDGRSLAEHLGMTPGQYALWMPRGDLPEGYVPPELGPTTVTDYPGLADRVGPKGAMAGHLDELSRLFPEPANKE